MGRPPLILEGIDMNIQLFTHRLAGGAHFEHDCDRCLFLGHYDGYDLYACSDTLIARYGLDGDYISGACFAPSVEPLYVAYLALCDMAMLNEHLIALRDRLFTDNRYDKPILVGSDNGSYMTLPLTQNWVATDLQAIACSSAYR